MLGNRFRPVDWAIKVNLGTIEQSYFYNNDFYENCTWFSVKKSILKSI